MVSSELARPTDGDDVAREAGSDDVDVSFASPPLNLTNAFSSWWKFADGQTVRKSHLHPQPACAAAAKRDVQALKECCSATAGCGGFLTNGKLLNADSLQQYKLSPGMDDLYVGNPHPICSRAQQRQWFHRL